MRKRLQYIEIDIPVCSLAYGVSPCSAEIGVTGEAKCFNTKRTCQDRANYAEETVTLRFGVDVGEYLPRDIFCIPCIHEHSDISFSAGEISLGQNLGTRSSLRVTFTDAPHSDAGEGYDPYRTERDYDPFKQGTHWGKFRSRQPFLQGRPIRWIQGFDDQTLEEMDTRHFFIESFEGPSLEGKYSITAKDILKFLDDDRALAPKPNNGEFDVEIDASETSAVLFPTGVGDEEYPEEGFAVLGGAEVVSFTRVGDTLTIVRGRLGTDGIGHEIGDRIQTALHFDQQKVSDILYILATEYAGVDPSYINLDTWHDEDDSYIGRLYTATIAEPTSVRKLFNELIHLVGLAVWWDDVNQKIRFQAIREIQADAGLISPENMDEGSLDIIEQLDSRLSDVRVFYGLRSPLHPLDEFTSYREARFLISENAREDYGVEASEAIYTRWIARLQTNTASRVGVVRIGRFQTPPRKFSWTMFRQQGGVPIEVGGLYQLTSWPLQNAFGETENTPIQITRLVPGPDRFHIEAEEMVFAELDLGDIGDPDPPPPPDAPIERVITLTNGTNVNLRSTYDLLYDDFGGATEEDKIPITFILPTGLVIGSSSAANPALDTGSFPSDIVDLKFSVRGKVQGRGGNGGRGGTQNPFSRAGNGGAGGIAIRATSDITIDVGGGSIWGGGGGGGGAATVGGWTYNTRGGGGGGGAGVLGGAGGNGPDNAQSGGGGSPTAGGGGGSSWTKTHFWESEYLFSSVRGGSGGSPGQPGLSGAAQSGGDTGSPGSGGAAGPAIKGINFVIITGSGSILGPQVV